MQTTICWFDLLPIESLTKICIHLIESEGCNSNIRLISRIFKTVYETTLKNLFNNLVRDLSAKNQKEAASFYSLQKRLNHLSNKSWVHIFKNIIKPYEKYGLQFDFFSYFSATTLLKLEREKIEYDALIKIWNRISIKMALPAFSDPQKIKQYCENTVLKKTPFNLDLSGLDLLLIPEPICQFFKQVECLDLSKNEIKEITAIAKYMSKLKILDISKNKMEKIPTDLKNFTEIELIDLSYNKIKELPSEICNLKNLILLDLKNNGLQNLPDEWDKMNRLLSLYLGNNKFSTFPYPILKAPFLGVLHVENNKLTNIPRYLVQKLIFLREFNIENNPIQSIPVEILSHTLRIIHNN
ncbi:MAG: leucine-rich repeat domain-containing protein [Chlamydiae bacterium]|nr:leucine-rich repeat domain-containing protein [Chlamydiota bacterium]